MRRITKIKKKVPPPRSAMRPFNEHKWGRGAISRAGGKRALRAKQAARAMNGCRCALARSRTVVSHCGRRARPIGAGSRMESARGTALIPAQCAPHTSCAVSHRDIIFVASACIGGRVLYDIAVTHPLCFAFFCILRLNLHYRAITYHYRPLQNYYSCAHYRRRRNVATVSGGAVQRMIAHCTVAEVDQRLHRAVRCASYDIV